ncbi:MAG: translation initiation factor IF-2 N-terminal domain-containing protein, partial [Fervidicoccus fontis]
MGLNSKELTTRLQQMGFSVKNHMSTLEESEVKRIKQIFGKEKEHSDNKLSSEIEQNKNPQKDIKPKRIPRKITEEEEDFEEYEFRKQKREYEEYKKKVLAQKEEIRRSQEESQRKLFSKIASISAHGHGKKKRKGSSQPTSHTRPTKIVVGDKITVQELADRMQVESSEVIKKLIE